MQWVHCVKIYIEWVAFLVWNLSNGIDVDETRKTVEKYKKDNEALIRKNNIKMVNQHDYTFVLDYFQQIF